MLNIKTTVILTVFACLGFSSIAAGQDNVPVPVPEFLKNVPFKIEGVDGFLQSLGIDPKAEPKKFSKKEKEKAVAFECANELASANKIKRYHNV